MAYQNDCMSLNLLLSFAVFVIGSFLAVGLFLKHKQLSVRLFCFSLFTLSYNTFVIFLFESRYLSQVPFLLRTPSILSYLTFPALFFIHIICFTKQGTLSLVRPAARDPCNRLHYRLFTVVPGQQSIQTTRAGKVR